MRQTCWASEGQDRLSTSRPKEPWHCNADPKMREFFDGLLLGGGNVTLGGGKNAAFFVTLSEKREYLEWVSTHLKTFRITSTLTKIKTKRPTEWRLRTPTYYELFEVFSRWYKKGEKDIPLDLQLTPIIGLCWFLRGGNLEITGGKVRKALRFWVGRYSLEAINHLLSELRRIGIQNPSFYIFKGEGRKMIRIPGDKSERLLDYIGECPEELEKAFGHKWKEIRGP